MKGEEIKALRLRLGLTQTELAAEIGVHRVTVAKWETGGKTPLPIIQRALADLDTRRSRVQARAGQGGA